jgi:hypothetical protein
MGTHTEGLTVKIGDGAETEVFTELGLYEVPELFSASPALIPAKTTADKGSKTKKNKFGTTDGDEYAFTYQHDYENAAQDLLRAALHDDDGVNIQVIISDGTTTETHTANFLVMSTAYVPGDPNGDGDPDKEVATVKRNSDWVTT